MKMTRNKIVAIITVAGALAAVIGLSSFALGDSSPPDPPWINPTTHGIDVTKMPARMPVANSQGVVIGYVNTKDVMVGPGQDPPSIPLFRGPSGTTTTGKFWKRGAPPEGGPSVAPIITSGTTSPSP